jgi:PKD repeat protein
MKNYSIFGMLRYAYAYIQPVRTLSYFLSTGAMILIITSCSKSEAPAPAPIAGFSFPAHVHYIDSLITYTNTSTNATSYLWDFGDPASGANNSSTAVNGQHTYSATGNYSVKLTATGSGGTNNVSQFIELTCHVTVVEVSGNIDVPTTWDYCHLYHCTGFITVNAPLTIESSTIIKFDDQKGMIVANGGSITAKPAVFFTSSKNDIYGGDTNGDGNATVAEPGDWADISLGTTSGNSFDQCFFAYGGYASTDHERVLNMGDGENNIVNNCTFEYNAGGVNDVYAALDMSRCPQSCKATNNLFFANHGHPVLIGISTDFDNSNKFLANGCDGIFVDVVDAADQAINLRWTNKQVPYVLGGWSSNSWAMDAGKILILGDSVIIKFARYTTPGFSLLIPDGNAQIQNFAGPGVVFTSYNDDSHGGDTNGDGVSAGTPGYWEGIYTAGPLWFTWPNILFAAH